jgi:hypothetical protein
MKDIYRIVRHQGTIYEWLYQVEKLVRPAGRFLFFKFEEEWERVGTAEVSLEKAKESIKRLQKYGGNSVVYRSDLDDVVEKEILDE